MGDATTVSVTWSGAFSSVSTAAGASLADMRMYNTLMAVAAGVVPLALGFLVNLAYPFHPVRYERLLLFASPLFLIYVGCGIVAGDFPATFYLATASDNVYLPLTEMYVDGTVCGVVSGAVLTLLLRSRKRGVAA